MSAVFGLLLFLLKVVGVLLLVVLAIVLMALVLPATVWLDYRDGALLVHAGIPGIKLKVFPPKELTAEQQAKKDAQKAKKDAEKKAKKEAEKAAKEKAKAERKASGKKDVPKGKNALLQLTFEQICKAVGGVGRFGKSFLGMLRIKHIHVYLPVHGDDAADTAIKYGKLQAWLHTGLSVLNRMLWLEFDEFRLDPDFMGDRVKSERFSCQISARLIIIVIAAIRLLWLLWTEKILDPLLDQLAGKKK